MQTQSIRRIIMGLGTIVFVGALAAGATGAFFSDTETSTGNTLAAGAIDLKIDNTSYGFDWNDPTVPLDQATGVWGLNEANSWTVSDLTNQLFFSFRDLKPGDYGEDTISIHVDNNDAYACMAFDLTSTPDNGINEPEADAGDATDGPLAGELQNYLSFLFWYDDGDNVFETGEVVIPELSGAPGSVFTGTWLPIAESGDAPLPGGTTQYIGKGWCFGTMTQAPVAQDGVGTNPPVAPARVGFTCNGAGNHNDAQSDGIVVDVAFQAVQSRNNAQFLCSSLPPLEGGEQPVRPTIGAAVSSYVAPTGPACDVTVASTTPASDTIAEGIALATPGQTVCVEAGTYAEDVVVNQDITLAGAGSGSTNIIGQTSGEAGAVVITADGATVQGFNITDATGGFAALRISGARTGITVTSNTLNGVTGGAAFLTDGGQTNHTISNNVINGGDAGQPIAYVNGLASVNVASTNVDFTNNTFSGSGTLALGQEAGASSITQNRFSAVTSFTDVEDWEGGNNYNQNNFNDAGLNLQHSENGNTGDNGITNAENNWWGDLDPSDGDVSANVDVDFSPSEVAAFPQN